MKKYFSPSGVVLIIANLVPLFGVLFLGWDIFQIMMLYWIESAIVGFFTIIKMYVAGPLSMAIPLTIFFFIHFGAFMLGHLLFIVVVFNPTILHGVITLDNFGNVLKYAFTFSWIAIINLFLSHLYSFFYNFLDKKEYSGLKADYFFAAPYSRILVMHFTLMLSALLVFVFHLEVLGLVLMIILKISIDTVSHTKQRRRGLINDKTIGKIESITK